MPIKSKEEKQKRLEICRKCEHYATLIGIERCNECGCFDTLKTHLAQAKCPLNPPKWKAEEQEEK